MARLTRDTAWRSLRELLAALPKDATVQVVKTGPPPAGITLAVRVEIATAGQAESRTATGGGTGERELQGGADADVPDDAIKQ